VDLYLLIDYSSSMNQTVQGTYRKRIDVVWDKLKDFLRKSKIDFKRIYLYTFSENLDYIGKFNTTSEVLNGIRSIFKKPAGGTRIWDCIIDVMNNADNNNKTFILCITDGEDRSSIFTYRDVINRLKTNEKIELHILDITGRLKDREDDVSNIIKPIKRIESIDVELDELIQKSRLRAEKDFKPFRISVP